MKWVVALVAALLAVSLLWPSLAASQVCRLELFLLLMKMRILTIRCFACQTSAGVSRGRSAGGLLFRVHQRRRVHVARLLLEPCLSGQRLPYRRHAVLLQAQPRASGFAPSLTLTMGNAGPSLTRVGHNKRAGYGLADIKETEYGFEASLELMEGKNLFGTDVATLHMSVYFDTEVTVDVVRRERGAPKALDILYSGRPACT